MIQIQATLVYGRISLHPSPQRRSIVPMPEDVVSCGSVQPSALVQVAPVVGIGASAVAAICDLHIAVGIVKESFLHGAAGAGQRGRVPVGILLGIKSSAQAGTARAQTAAGGVVVPGNQAVDIGLAPDVLVGDG